MKIHNSNNLYLLRYAVLWAILALPLPSFANLVGNSETHYHSAFESSDPIASILAFEETRLSLESDKNALALFPTSLNDCVDFEQQLSTPKEKPVFSALNSYFITHSFQYFKSKLKRIFNP